MEFEIKISTKFIIGTNKKKETIKEIEQANQESIRPLGKKKENY